MGLEESGMRGMRGAVFAVCAVVCAAASAGEGRLAAKFEGDRKLVVEFAEAMRTWNNGLRDDVVRITPALPSRCAWDSDTRLTCQLEHARADATRYRIDVAAGLKTQSGQALRAGRVWVETPRPQLSARVERWSAGMPWIVVTANMPVDTQAVRTALRMHADGQPLQVGALRQLPPLWSGDRTVRFALVLPEIAQDKRVLALDVQPGLRALPGPLRGEQKARLLTAWLREPFALRGVTCAGRGKPAFVAAQANGVEAACVPGEPVLLMFSRTLDAKSLDAIRARLPAGITVSEGWEGEVRRDTDVVVQPARPIRLASPEPNARLEFELDGSIRSSDGAVLPAAKVRIVTGDAQPQIRAMKGGALVADGSQPPVLMELLNAKAATLQVHGVARQYGSETVHAAGQPGTAAPIGSAVATRTLAEGGWVRWSTGKPENHWNVRTTQVEFAAPSFDLLAVAGRREVLVWANEWDRDAPAAGVDVELLWRDRDDAEPRVAARGRTGADGTVLLRLSEEVVVAVPTDEASRWNWNGPSWLLRAVDADGGRRAVLPVGETSYGQSTGLAPAQKIWGVSDRPLYRAGETVHYRLWQRERRGVHLHVMRPTPVKLRLFDTEREKAVLQWQATPDARGSIVDDLALPIHLTDATYCIGVDDGRGETDGTCFFVGTYRAQDLWVEATSKGGVLRDGDRYVADVRAGYFSGGVAAGAEAEPLGVTLWPLPLSEAYPQYERFAFIDVDDDDTETPDLAGVPAQAQLDSEGGLHIDVPVAFDREAEHRPAFATLALEAQVSPADREGTTGSDQATRYARFDRYVGLRVSPQWFGRDDKVSVEVVVITAHGESVSADVEVVVEYVADFRSKAPGERLARCVVHSGVATPCDFPRRHSGFYRLIARSGDAAPARWTQYVWAGDAGITSDVEEPELAVLDSSPQRTGPIRVLIQQNFERARALFVIANGDTILGHRIETLVGKTRSVSLPVSRDWRGRLSIKAYVREVAAAQVDGGYRKPVPVEELETYVAEAQLEPGKAPLAVRFQTTSAQPGAHASLVLRNDTRQPRSVTVAVTDDALRAQAQRWLPYADPQGVSGFASWLDVGTRGTNAHDFSDWTGSLWQSLLPWSETAATAEVEPLPPPPEQPSVELEAPSPVDVPAAAPGLVRNRADSYGEATTLDRIQVTGSRIRRADIVESNEAKAPDPSLRPRQESQATAANLQSVRSRFADTALWLPAIRLAPGESRRIDVALPDNLTRWRAVVWSTGDADDFAMTEATLEAGLPVEARLQAPVRLYPGDTARVATSIRHVAATPAVAQTTLEVQGPGDNPTQTYAQPIALAARGQDSVATTLRPQEPGELHLVASARTPAGGDAVAGTIEVASPLIASRKLQAGWVAEDTLRLDLPSLPEAAHAPSLRVSLLRGGAGLTSQWTHDLRVYPHRCWEQILSRAVGAALALERNDSSWPDAATAVKEALDNAAVFQLDDGGFVYFPGMGSYHPEASVPLTAYTLRAFALLRSLGYAVPERIEADAREFVSQIKAPAQPPRAGIDEGFARFAYAAAEQAPERSTDLDALWSHWDRLPLPVQVAGTRALAQVRHPSAARAVQRLLERAPARGPARSLRLPRRYDAWMSSELREQCSLIELLRDHPQLASSRVRRELLTGMNDLYAGGVATVDTQTAASCLMALRDPAGDSAQPAQVRFAVGTREKSLELAQNQAKAEWEVGAPDGTQLQVAAASGNTVPVSYVAQLDYLEDARTAQASAVGLSIERRYGVLHEGAWKPVEGQVLREGDWIRITLVVRTSATREFVAVTDAVPGGLQPTDLELSGVGTAELKRIADEGSGYFETRKLDARSPRFYAEALPAGDHELHYFARVGNSGDYLAAPAAVELMYGSATYARTAATRLRISEAASGRAGVRAD